MLRKKVRLVWIQNKRWLHSYVTLTPYFTPNGTPSSSTLQNSPQCYKAFLMFGRSLNKIFHRWLLVTNCMHESINVKIFNTVYIISKYLFFCQNEYWSKMKCFVYSKHVFILIAQSIFIKYNFTKVIVYWVFFFSRSTYICF